VCSCVLSSLSFCLRVGILCGVVGTVVSVRQSGVVVGVCYGWHGFKSVSKILLGKIVESSFRSGVFNAWPVGHSPLPWPASRFEKITTNASPARCLHFIFRFVVRLTLRPLFPVFFVYQECNLQF
jgi:hypothetical protein